MRKYFTKLKKIIKWPKSLRLPKNKQELKYASRHPFAVPFFTFGILAIVGLGAFGVASITNSLPSENDANIVIISYDGKKQTVPSKQTSVSELLDKLDIPINQGDVVEPAASTMIDQDQFRINIYRAVPVTIVDGERRVASVSAARTPRAIAVQSGEQVYPEDIVTTTPADDFLKTGGIGEQVDINRATPISVDLYGTPVTLRTHAKTIGELIKEKNIKLVQNDRVEPAANTPISPNQKVSFIRTGTKVETVTEVIATPVEIINDATLAYGTKAVRQQGSPGQQTVTYEVDLTNNVVTARRVIQKIVNKEAVKQVEVLGTSISGIKGDMARAGISPGDFAAVDYIVSGESNWRPNAGGPGRPYGLCQAFPGTKMASAGADWQTNPVTQLRWCAGYAQSRYGGWQAAQQYWVNNRHW